MPNYASVSPNYVRMSPNYVRMRRRARAMVAPAFVAAVWLVMSSLAAVYVGSYASPIPFKDDMSVLKWVAPGHRMSPAMLWALHNEHRVPLPKLLHIGITRLTQDFRAAMFLEVAILASLSLGLILVARRLRGRTSVTDAFFPLLFLHWGNAENLLMGFQLALTLPVALSSAFLMIVVAGPAIPTARASLWLGVCMLALPLCGGPGITQVPPMAAWMGAAGLVGFRSAEVAVRRSSRVMLAATVLVVALSALYCVGYRTPPRQDQATSAGWTLRIAAQVVALAFGPSTPKSWPIAAAAVGILLAATTALLAVEIARGPAERARASGLLACIGAPLALALAIGWGRGGGMDHVGLAPRYVTLTAPLLCGVYLSWLRYGPRRLGGAIRFGLAGATALLAFSHAELGKQWGERRAAAAAAVEADVRSGMPIVGIAARHWRTLYVDPRRCAERLEILHAAGLSPFRGLPYEANPAMLECLVFHTYPVRALTTHPLLNRRADGVPVLLAHPECQLIFELPSGAKRLSGRFGIHPEVQRSGGSDGVRFSIERVVDPSHPEVLFERFLDPESRPEDRGFHSLSVEIPGDGRGELVLRTSNPPGHDDEADWAFWTEIEIE